ncbi:MAG: carboxymuconolactone decarboxylase family protein [Dehalococcoidia bacterium]
MEATVRYTRRSDIEQARPPELIEAVSQLRDVVFSRDSSVPYSLKREIFTISSIAAGCTHCQAHGSYSLHREGLDDARIHALWDFARSPLFEESERAAFRFARDASLAPNATTAEHHAALREHYSDAEIAELLSVISLAGWLNRWNDSLATVTDEESASWAEEHLSAVGWERGRHASDA